ncbi:hypothetical protein LOZ53_001933 [Ophidiomyces ophidiicola]|nr:hypothetical protein LOZ53_001933 [Ophidiomyces ophidiicola]
MASKSYALENILAVAKVHPFYSDVEYPPTRESLAKILAEASENDNSKRSQLKDFPLIRKETLYQSIKRLSADTNPRNGYRQHGYISVTGGGSGGVPMLFVTDSAENRKHRDVMGSLIRGCGLIKPGDWMLTMHISGFFYRALDLVTELVEQAGGSVLCAGHNMSYAEVVAAAINYQVNVIAGDGSQMVQLAAYISSLPPAQREAIRITKFLYTSEPLIRAQRAFIRSVMGPIAICSILGSSEAGAWAVANLDLTGDTEDDYTEFIFDTRSMVIEVLPMSVEDEDQLESNPGAVGVSEVAEGEIGIIVQTSLQRLRHPLVRYVSGDMGSLRPLPAAALASIPAADAPYMKFLRLYGRDRRFSFKWYAEYFTFAKLETFMRTPAYGIMQWQVVLSYTAGTPEIALEVRVFRPGEDTSELVSTEDVTQRIKRFFGLLPINEHLFNLVFVRSADEFERSKTGNKIIKFVDRTKKL